MQKCFTQLLLSQETFIQDDTNFFEIFAGKKHKHQIIWSNVTCFVYRAYGLLKTRKEGCLLLSYFMGYLLVPRANGCCSDMSKSPVKDKDEENVARWHLTVVHFLMISSTLPSASSTRIFSVQCHAGSSDTILLSECITWSTPNSITNYISIWKWHSITISIFIH